MDKIYRQENEHTINNILIVNEINDAIEALKRKETIARFEYGYSMLPMIDNGEYCIVRPINSLDEVKVGDAVVCKVYGVPMTHLVHAISDCGYNGKKYFLIGSTSFHLNGWTDEIFGIAKGTNIFEK